MLEVDVYQSLERSPLLASHVGRGEAFRLARIAVHLVVRRREAQLVPQNLATGTAATDLGQSPLFDARPVGLDNVGRRDRRNDCPLPLLCIEGVQEIASEVFLRG